jgi:hypothetical protein
MSDEFRQRLQSVDATMLTPLVCQALANNALRIDEWQLTPLQKGGGQVIGGVLGIFRFGGRAFDRHTGTSLPWSLILKAFSGTSSGSVDMSTWNYWKREPLVYQSGLLEALPGGLTAPRCYAVHTYPPQEFWVWMEDIQESNSDWTLERFGLAAQDLGRFNGAYLAGYPLPTAHPWMTWGRTKQWCAITAPLAERIHNYRDTPIVKRLLPGRSFERTLELWAGHSQLLTGFERLPVCFCHHDAFHRNLLARPGSQELVAIDWSISGFGRVGEEVGITTAVSLSWLGMSAGKARELDQAVFSGYVEGLRAVGWQGDARLARLGYAVNAFLLTGITWMLFWCESLQEAEGRSELEAIMGASVDVAIDQWAEVQPFLLDLGEEAYQLIATM